MWTRCDRSRPLRLRRGRTMSLIERSEIAVRMYSKSNSLPFRRLQITTAESCRPTADCRLGVRTLTLPFSRLVRHHINSSHYEAHHAPHDRVPISPLRHTTARSWTRASHPSQHHIMVSRRLSPQSRLPPRWVPCMVQRNHQDR